MRRPAFVGLALALFFICALARATIFGNVRGVVHDPQHRPVSGATVELKAVTSDWLKTTVTDADGNFSFSAVPVGDYTVTVKQTGFADAQQRVTVIADTSPVLHFQLKIATVSQKTLVSAQSAQTEVRMDTVTPTTLVDREDIEQTPGADRSNSLQIITDFVPGAYYTHDQLHIRGGHQVSWLIDGVPVPNSNIASNVGPQFDPKDMDYLEVQRGSYDPAYGDRTYGVFDVVPRSGFERDNEGELLTSFGNFYQTNDQVSFGSHTNRFAYFTSLNFNSSNYGLQTPVGQIIHDAENGYGGFGSFLFNLNPQNQLRIVTSLRKDYYQIPNTPGQQAVCPQPTPLDANCLIRDGEHESDAFVNFSWVRTINPNLYFTVSPFYHYNRANYDGGPNDFPISTTDNRGSNYGGLQTTFNAQFWRNSFQAGLYGYGQHDNQLVGLVFNDQSNPNFANRDIATGGLVEGFIGDKFNVTSWLTLMAGVRLSHFTSAITENATSPRFGVTFKVPRLNWVFRAFYGGYYQPPPVVTVSGPLLEFVNGQNLAFVPLRGERDEENEFGVTIPIRGWTLDADTFQTRARNFFDHNNVGESDIFFPVTIEGALIQAWELTLRSPRVWNRAQFHLAYSNQVAKARGDITGGLTCVNPADCSLGPVYVPLDHDQRNTLNVGFNADLPRRAFIASNVYYGSGFTNGNPDQQFPGPYLPGHTTVDLTLGKSFGENYRVSVTALNIANRHLLIDNSLTFGGFHYNDPRQIYVEFRWRFHY
jgi:hypothetical protein